MHFNQDGTDDIKKRPAVVVYAVSVLGKIPFIARDAHEATFLKEAVLDMGAFPFIMDIEVPIGFKGWYYPKPLAPSAPSLN